MPRTINKRVNRRSFLKQLGAIALGIGIGYGLGCLTIKLSTQTITNTQIKTVTERITETTIVKLSSLYGRLFFDYNGNGEQDKNEPAIAKARVYLKDNFGNIISEAFTDSSGDYKLEDVPAGSYRLYVEADKKFRYMCRSREEFRAIKKGYEVLLSEPGKIDIGLMNGFLTLPFPKKSRLLEEPYYVDLDLRINFLRDWKGGKRTVDQHLGTDYCFPEGQDIVAPAPGKVIEAVNGWPNVPSDPNLGLLDDGNRVTIDHGFIDEYGNRFYTIYCHLKSADCSIGQIVKRGDKIATSGNTGYKTKGPHLHFQCGGFGLKRVDPYRDLHDLNAVSYWTKDNDPQYPL